MIDQAAYWNSPTAARWVREQAALDEMLRPFGAEVLDAARVTPGESVIDLGCGCGDTTLELAARVGPQGRVLGIDVSAQMLKRARERGKGLSYVSFIEGDASRSPLERKAFESKPSPVSSSP